jgi:zinc protease
MTAFTAEGTEEEVRRLLEGACQTLRSLPADCLDTEKQILAAEAETRSFDFISMLMLWRYGARGWGVAGLPEYGVRNAAIDELNQWVSQVFTRENAVLWISGEPPAGLRLDLPAGAKRAVPNLPPTQQTYPAWLVDDHSGGVACTSLVPRMSASPLFQQIAAKRMEATLRTERALSYSPQVIYDALTADTAHLVLFGDSLENSRTELARAFGEVYAGFDQIAESELEEVKATYADGLTGHFALRGDNLKLNEIRRAAVSRLLGHRYDSPEELVAGSAQVTLDDMSAFVTQMKATVMFSLPGAAIIEPWMGESADMSPGVSVEGRRVARSNPHSEPGRLVYGIEGVSLVYPDDSHVTVRYAQIEGALTRDDGSICVIGSDANALTIEPGAWRSGARVCREVRAMVPPHLIIDQGPVPVSPQRRVSQQVPAEPSTVETMFHWIGIGASVVWALIALAVIVDEGDPSMGLVLITVPLLYGLIRGIGFVVARVVGVFKRA